MLEYRLGGKNISDVLRLSVDEAVAYFAEGESRVPPASVILGRMADDAGKSVIVIEHHQAVMAHADWIIDIGPRAGHDGGKVVFEGTPTALVAGKKTLTGEHLAAYVRA